MSLAQPAFTSPIEPHEERRFQRVSVVLAGRYMLESLSEYPCRTVNMSPGDMTLAAPVKAQTGEKVVVYLEEIGRLTGVAIRQTDTGFSIVMNLPLFKRDKLADQITWFANRHLFQSVADRRHHRVVPLMQRALMRFPDGRENIVKIVDISLSGAGLETDLRPEIGTRILLGSKSAMIVRHYDGGLGAEFEQPFRLGELDESTRL